MKTPSKFLHILALVLMCSFSTAQKKNPIYLGIDGENKRAVLTYKNGDAFVLSLPDLSVLKKLSPTVPEDRIWHAELSPDGKKLAICHDKSKKVVVWDVESGTSQFEIPVRTIYQQQMFEFDPTRNQLICRVSAKGGPAYSVYDLATGNVVGPLPKMENKFLVARVMLSPDGKKLLTFGNASSMDHVEGGYEVFDYQTGEKIGEKQIMSTGQTIVSARFIGNDSVQVNLYDQDGRIGSDRSKSRFAISDNNENRLIIDNWKGKELEYSGSKGRFVVKDQVELSVPGHLLDKTAFASNPGWLLTITTKPDMLTLYSTANAEAKSEHGSNWKEPALVTTVVLP